MNATIGEKPDNLSGMLLEWYDTNRRILPWREDPSPYHVWISEIMLQQTRVEAVRDYYTRFLEVLPTIGSLAEADEDLCTKLWQGLGYYSRVRNLRRAAIMIMKEYGGAMPQTSAELCKLPGIGRYTAAAIASICYNERIPAIDGNLLRVYARMTGYDQDIRSGAAREAALGFYEELFPYERCGDFNQALMDLGACVCLPNGAPHCEDCPWEDHCRARSDGTCQQLPVVLPKAKRRVENRTVFLIYYQDRLILRRRPDEGLLAGLYEYPNTDGVLNKTEAASYLHSLGFSALRLRSLPEAKHVFSHIEWKMTGWEVLADKWDTSDSENPHAQELFPATASDLREIYSIPSAFSGYTKLISPDLLK